MRKRIVICADGTWNRPEADLEKNLPTNVLRLARAIRPIARDGTCQQVFYDWGVGSYYDRITGGFAGKGINKNIMDGYRYIVQNYNAGDELHFFGFSRGAYTIRSLCGLINNCGILRRPDARLIQEAFEHYKRRGARFAPDGDRSKAFRRDHSHRSRRVRFMGLWDTVGSLGIPFSVLGLLDGDDEFYDTRMGRNVSTVRHALAIDEARVDLEPTIIAPRPGDDIKQVWFAGGHSDVGGGNPGSVGGGLLSDLPLAWMLKEAGKAGLEIETHLRRDLTNDPRAKLHRSRRHLYRLRKKYERPIDHRLGKILIHESVKARWDANRLRYRPANLEKYLDSKGWPARLVG